MKKIIPFIIGIFVLTILVMNVGLSDIAEAASLANIYLLLASFLILILTTMIKNLRWNFLLKRVSKCGLKKSSLIYFVGQLTNEVMPIGSGELVRTYWVKRADKSSFTKPLSSIIVERVFDLIILLIIVIFGINIILNLEGFSHFLVLSTLIILAVIVLAIRPKIIKPLLRILPKKISSKILDKMEDFEKAKISYKKSVLFLTLIVTIIAWLVETCGQMVLIYSFGYSIPFFKVLAIVTISWLLGTFSFLPGGLGAREAVFAYLLTLSNVPLNVAITISLVYRAFVYLVFIILTVFFLLINKMRIRDFAA
ncbi:MAG: flippase-like domain-containing protein [Candidatus Aenigmarchaeota archaeon]|nr:flippase-like domain-containing protein [Candidatus Aenigmarchaeota archaeon]